MKKILLFLLILPAFISAQKKWSDPSISVKDLKAHLYYLASDDMKGRFSGSPEERIAADYIRNQFESYGLEPLFDGNYFQDFPFVERLELTSNNSAELNINEHKVSLKINEDFTTVSFSGRSKLKAPLVFAGYGISSANLEYDDYKSIDVKDKIVIILRDHPEHDSAHSEFDRYASLRSKASIARDKGAAGIIFVNGYFPSDDDNLVELRYDGAPAINDFPVIQVKRNIIENLFRANNLDLKAIQKKIDSTKQGNPVELKNCTAEIQTEVKEIISSARNVGGLLKSKSGSDEYIVVGAHFDHLGIDQLKSSSMYRGSDRQIHNGADDNASGTSAMLELAEALAANQPELKRNIIFLAFSGEELGILGSTYFTNNSPVPLDKIIAMVNMDMVGRLNEENSLTVIGAGTSSAWKPLLNEKNKYDLKLTFDDAGTGGSDHQAFSNKNIPVLFFFTGTHSDYHKPSDDADKINYEGEKKIVSYIFDVINGIDKLEEKPDYVKVEAPTNRRIGKSRVYVGTVPEFGYNGEGYKLSGVTDGSPAAKAGLMSGDIIIRFGAQKISNIYDFMRAMAEYKPGDQVEVAVLRDGKEMKFIVDLVAK
ncbi:M20/M25/M40 family metallo-hydrolase [Melioribacter sp. Ez-97]|uniref:M20/M25/M40 family metallo-hydrolase n=1 Tax=Melioribacter sp. Ez-97 TaxID=3423434 RepID=UPI003EDB0865